MNIDLSKINLLGGKKIFFLGFVFSLMSCQKRNLYKSSSQYFINDSSYNLQPYVKRDDSGRVIITGQYINGKRDGTWRFFSYKRLYRTEFYDKNKLVLVVSPETINEFGSYDLFTPDSEKKKFVYKNSELKFFRTENDSLFTEDEITNYKNLDTVVINRKVGASFFYSVITNKANSFYNFIIPLKDTMAIFIDLKSGKYEIKK